MSSLTLHEVCKNYGKKQALFGVDLDVADGEFFVILGPSGAGKTTTLKSVAGLEEIDGGTVSIDGQDMDGVEPYRRNVGMAFESYALYPQDTVFENLSSPLRSGRFGKYSAEDQKQRIDLVTTSLGINHLLQRFPRELSNGQRQRVALGRVMVRPAGIYLLDEPLSHLDAKLRAQMRTELKSLGSMSKTTTLYVTHDYQEALALGDKIAVLRRGVVVQVGTPLEVWREPSNVFVARALGQPEINLIPVRVEGGRFVGADGELRTDVPKHLTLPDARDGKAVLAVRPREVEVEPAGTTVDDAITVRGTIRLAELLGRSVELSIQVGDTELIAVVDSDHAPDEGDHVEVVLRPEVVLVFAEQPELTGDDAPLVGSLDQSHATHAPAHVAAQSA